MPYQITITADSLSELGGKALALGTALSQSNNPVMPEVKEAATKAPAKEKPVKEKAAPAGQTDTSAADTSEATNAGASTSTAPAATEAPAQDFTATVRDLVLAVVQKFGRDDLTAILDQFGIQRATQVAEDRQGELLDALRDKLDG